MAVGASLLIVNHSVDHFRSVSKRFRVVTHVAQVRHLLIQQPSSLGAMRIMAVGTIVLEGVMDVLVTGFNAGLGMALHAETPLFSFQQGR